MRRRTYIAETADLFCQCREAHEAGRVWRFAWLRFRLRRNGYRFEPSPFGWRAVPVRFDNH